MMLDEVIKRAEEVAQEKLYEYQECLAVHDMENAMDCMKCGEYHKQLAEWLIELKHLKEREQILDKIEDEIAQMDFDFGDYYDNTESIIEMVCNVIDKYKMKVEG